MAFGRAGTKLKNMAIAKDEAGLPNVYGDADAYRAALEKAVYADTGRQYGQGLIPITNYLARSGPLADSGAATALRARLASQIYGAASGRVASGYADYLAQLLNQRRQFNYQRQLMSYQKKLNKKSLPSSLLEAGAGVAGGYLAGGPYGAVAGGASTVGAPSLGNQPGIFGGTGRP